MDDKNLNFQTYQDLQTIFAAKRKKSKTKTMPVESSPFLQACSHLYQTGPKLFTENNYELLKQYPRLSEEILAYVRPSQIQALFGNYQDSDEIVYNRIYILSVLHKHGILDNTEGKLNDQDWIRFLSTIDAAKLEQYVRVFIKIEPVSIDNPEFFRQLKSHNDLEHLPHDLQFLLSLSSSYGTKPSFSEDTQIKGFTLINEFVCKRTRSFPKTWRQAMYRAWETPSLETSFELYKLYSERESWLNGFIGFPLIYSFFSYFYSKPIFQTFKAEPLTQVCKLLQSTGELNIHNFKILADMPQTALDYCQMLKVKMRLNSENLENIKDIPESILQHICASNKKQVLSIANFDLLIRLGKQGIDGTHWIAYKPNLLIISRLNDAMLKLLDSLDLNEQIFERIKYLHDHKFIDLFDKLNKTDQKLVLTNPHYEKIMILLGHLDTIGLFTPGNVRFIVDNQARILDDNQMFQSILNLEKSYTSRDQKRFNRITQQGVQAGFRPIPHLAGQAPTGILSTLPDEQITEHVSQKLYSIGILMGHEELERYSPAVLEAFYAIIPLSEEDNLLNQNNIEQMLRLFSSAPDPKIRSRCIIILSQCGLLTPKNLISHVLKLESVYNENPALFKEVYAEAWLQTETSSKWLENTLTAGLQETDSSQNAEETLLQRYLIENEENSAYLALDDIKYRIADHARSPILQQAIKLFDKSKLNIESIFDELLQTNEEQIQKIHAYLFMLDKSALLDAKNALQVLKHGQDLYGEPDFLRTMVIALKAQPEFNMSTVLKQKNFERIMSDQTSIQTKHKILEYLNLSIRNPNSAAKLAFAVADVADVAGHQAEIVQNRLKQSAGVFTAVATDLTQKVYGKMKLFSSPTPNIPELLSFYRSIASKSSHFKGSYYQAHQEQLNEDLSLLLSQDLLTEAHVIWLMEQPNQQTASRCLKLLTSANMLKGHEHWQSKLSSLSSAEADDLTNLEHKCQRLISSKERQEVKESTIQIWLEPLLRNQGHTHKKQ